MFSLMTTQGVTVDISALANLFSVLWNRVSRDALLDILISVEHICKTPALTKGDLYAPAYAEKKILLSVCHLIFA